MRTEEEFKDQTLRDLTRLAHNTLNRIRNLSRERGGGSDNPLGFLGLTLLFCSILQGLALQEGADMAQAFVAQIVEKKKPGLIYVG